MSSQQELLAISGLILFVLGLINGALIPKIFHPRLALSAHLTAVQSATFLIAMGWMWPIFAITDLSSTLLAWSLILSIYAVWFAILLSAIWGAGRNLPIAAQGATSSKARQRIVTVILSLGSVGSLISSVWLLAIWVIHRIF